MRTCTSCILAYETSSDLYLPPAMSMVRLELTTFAFAGQCSNPTELQGQTKLQYSRRDSNPHSPGSKPGVLPIELQELIQNKKRVDVVKEATGMHTSVQRGFSIPFPQRS